MAKVVRDNTLGKIEQIKRLREVTEKEERVEIDKD